MLHMGYLIITGGHKGREISFEIFEFELRQKTAWERCAPACWEGHPTTASLKPLDWTWTWGWMEIFWKNFLRDSDLEMTSPFGGSFDSYVLPPPPPLSFPTHLTGCQWVSKRLGPGIFLGGGS